MNGELEPMSQRRYRKSGGCVCPFCRSKKIEGEEIVIDNGIAYQRVECLDCNKSWEDQYQLIKYTEAT